MADTPTFESPVLATHPSIDGATLLLRDESSTVKTLVRSDRPQFGVGFGSSVTVGAALVAGTRPDEWLLLGDAAAVADAEASIDRGGFTSVIPFTHGRALFELTGADSTRLLEKVCGIDWSDAMTPNGAVVTASVALVTCDIVRSDAGSTPSYVLICDRSFGEYLFGALVDAGGEFGLSVG